MKSRIDYFAVLCQNFASEILHNEEQQLLLLPFKKAEFEISFIIPMQANAFIYDLAIEKNGHIVFEDAADIPLITGDNLEDVEQMFRSEISTSIKELMDMDFVIDDGEIVFSE